MNSNWHLRLFKKSILKQNKLNAILNYLKVKAGERYLDIGGDNGIVSYFLRQQGGEWVSADLTDEAVKSIKDLVGGEVYRIDADNLPFVEDSFDGVVIIDFLEHINNDKGFIQKLHKIIKKNGTLIINVPNIKRYSLLNYARKKIGLGPESHGHVREGYNVDMLNDILGDKFNIVEHKTYSRFFTELMDAVIVLANKLSGKKITKKGLVLTEEDMKEKAKMFKIYSLLYPVMWVISKLDFLLFFTKGYSLIVKANSNDK